MTQRVIACSFVLSSLVLSTLSFPTWITDFTCDKKLEVNEVAKKGKLTLKFDSLYVSSMPHTL